jgi:transcriptional regulator with PAS, ATPase and Fis domain
LQALPENDVLVPDESRSYSEVMEMMEYRLLKRAMERYGSTHKAAKNLKLSQSTIVRKMKKLNIKRIVDN